MELDLREWLLVIGALVIVAVVIQGVIRVRRNRGKFKMKLDKTYTTSLDNKPEEDDWRRLLRAELPSGGARVVPASELAEPPAPGLGATAQDVAQDNTPGSTQDNIPGNAQDGMGGHQGTSEEAPAAYTDGPHADSSYADSSDADSSYANSSDAYHSGASSRSPADVQGHDASHSSASAMAERGPNPSDLQESDSQASHSAASEVDDAQAGGVDEAGSTTDAGGSPQKLVVLYVLAQGEQFPGASLAETLADTDMRFGEFDIYHRMGVDGTQQFSLANAVNPGTFDPSTMDDVSTPGVTLFMRLGTLANPLQVFDDMLNVAETIARDLMGEVRDESQSAMTPQTAEHYRQAIREYELKRKTGAD